MTLFHNPEKTHALFTRLEHLGLVKLTVVYCSDVGSEPLIQKYAVLRPEIFVSFSAVVQELKEPFLEDFVILSSCKLNNRWSTIYNVRFSSMENHLFILRRDMMETSMLNIVLDRIR